MKNTNVLHLPLYSLSALLVVAAGWSYFTRVDLAVRATGIVRPQGEAVQLTTEVGGRVIRVLFREGDEVVAGDLLLQIDDRSLRLREVALIEQIHQTENRLANLEERLETVAQTDELAAEIDSAEEDATVHSVLLNLEHARDHYRRTEQLFDEGLISKQSLEEARLSLDRAETERDRPSTFELKRVQAHNRLDDLSAERIPLQAALTAAYHDLEQCRIEIARRSITSPVTGKVTSLPKFKAGEVLSAGAAIASIVPSEQALVVEAWLAAADRPLVAVGQAARMQIDSVANIGGDGFDGTVESIAPDVVFNASGAGAYRVLVRPAEEASGIQLGMALRVNFISREERLLLLLFQKIRREFEDD